MFREWKAQALGGLIASSTYDLQDFKTVVYGMQFIWICSVARLGMRLP